MEIILYGKSFKIEKDDEDERNRCTPDGVHAALLLYGEPQEV
jgi:hypothetical protein